MQDSKTLIPTKPDGEVKYYDLESFNNLISTQPRNSWIKTNKFSQNAKYLPIRIVEQLLRGVFPFHQIEQTHEPKIIGNSIVCSVQLKVYNPILGDWLSYAGVGAVPIELNAKEAQHACDFEHINAKALHKNVPSALSFAVSNAAKKIGPLFGAHLNNDLSELITKR